jgi:multisubunit Na+/H+ antiporter MnhB subunit
MKNGRSLTKALMPWAGLTVGLLALAVVHQFGSDATFDDCRQNSPGPLLIVAVVGLLVCLASGFASWRSARASHSPSLRLVGAVSAASAALFAFAIMLAMIAAVVLPPCFG